MAEHKEEYIAAQRIMGEFPGSERGPSVLIFSGIHGNEKAGVYASRRIIDRIESQGISFKGNIYFILGNIGALNKGLRYQDQDLNRIWNRDHIEAIQRGDIEVTDESVEQIEIYDLIKQILRKDQGPFYFLDLHTTSSNSEPFITISDSLNNRKFSSHFPIPVVLGIEEYLDGPLLTFINEYGHVALGFEGGAHGDPGSVDNSEAFIWKALVYSGAMAKDAIQDFDRFEQRLSALCCKYQFFEITYRYLVADDERFTMKSGFENFEAIDKGQLLAESNGRKILAQQDGRIFMPLYQELGDDGYFILHPISKFWMAASKVARKWKIHHFLRLIPGVHQDPSNSFTLIVDPKIARFMAKEIFHLFGYRQQIYKDNKLHFIKRDRNLTDLH